MALPAIGVMHVVIAAGVTAHARFGLVCSDKRKLRRRMIEGRGPPHCLRVAGKTIVRKLIRRMAWILHAVERGFVTLPATGVLKLIIAVHMTLRAKNVDVSAGKRELRARVIERRRPPGGLIMARLAIMRNLIRRMAGVLRGIIRRFVTLPAIRVRKLIVPVDVTFFTSNEYVRPEKRELCRCMIERCRLPT
jgi:hypothetical protein